MAVSAKFSKKAKKTMGIQKTKNVRSFVAGLAKGALCLILGGGVLVFGGYCVYKYALRANDPKPPVENSASALPSDETDSNYDNVGDVNGNDVDVADDVQDPNFDYYPDPHDPIPEEKQEEQTPPEGEQTAPEGEPQATKIIDATKEGWQQRLYDTDLDENVCIIF